MGESSAKNLRGESMTDVIFNGSSGRKPVGQCTVELIFDNSDNTISGEFAQYNEISVKRSVNRDAQSQYSLNNVRCRRRDVTDLFLGTGLGPRSYSIIEQQKLYDKVKGKNTILFLSKKDLLSAEEMKQYPHFDLEKIKSKISVLLKEYREQKELQHGQSGASHAGYFVCWLKACP